MATVAAQELDIHFPKAGLHTAGPFGRQPARPVRGGGYARTTCRGVNVRAFDSITKRDRGGSRPGLTKYIPERLYTSRWVVQNLNAVVATTGSVPAVQLSSSGRVVYLVAVSRGVVKVATPGDTNWTDTTNNSGEEPPLNISGVMQSTPLNQKLYFADGTNYVYYNPPTNSVEAWSATAGSLPRDSDNNGARLAATWRGRIVLSGVLDDPQNWFMSKVGDPYDWNYTPSNRTATQAVAGNTSRLGLIGDVVTALIPITDDVMILGGDHTIYAMRGDPADSGQIDTVSTLTGIAFGKAWCMDPSGTVYFFGSKPGIWRMAGGVKPERVSTPIDPLLRDVDTGRTIITMAWDHDGECIHLFLTPDDQPAAAVHYTLEVGPNAFFQKVYANNDHNPLCVCEYDGNEAGDRAVLLGCWDGYVRQIDPDAADDDGTPIASEVLLGPIMTQAHDEMRLDDLQLVLADASGDVTWGVQAAATAESASARTPQATGTATGGRGNRQPVRLAGHAIYVKLSSTARWAMESLVCRFKTTGKVRRRGKGS